MRKVRDLYGYDLETEVCEGPDLCRNCGRRNGYTGRVVLADLVLAGVRREVLGTFCCNECAEEWAVFNVIKPRRDEWQDRQERAYMAQFPGSDGP